jgi:hypothetical protein
VAPAKTDPKIRAHRACSAVYAGWNPPHSDLKEMVNLASKGEAAVGVFCFSEAI